MDTTCQQNNLRRKRNRERRISISITEGEISQPTDPNTKQGNWMYHARERNGVLGRKRNQWHGYILTSAKTQHRQPPWRARHKHPLKSPVSTETNQRMARHRGTSAIVRRRRDQNQHPQHLMHAHQNGRCLHKQHSSTYGPNFGRRSNQCTRSQNRATKTKAQLMRKDAK